MPASINQADVQRALENNNTPSNYQGTVGTGSTASSVVDSVGGWATNQWTDYAIQFTGNTTTTALQGQWQKISSNTSNTLTLAASLPATPVAGDTYNIRPFGQQTLNLNAVGGTTQTPANWTTLFQGLYNAIATIGSAIKTTAMQIAGTDGTNARTLLTDTDGTTQGNITKIKGTDSTYSALLSPNTTLNPPVAKSVGTTAVQLDSGLTNRRYILVVNNGTDYIYVGTSAVTAASGIPIAAGASMTLNLGPALSLYGIAGSTQDTRVMEVA